jgi:hypothetical protein
VGRNYAGVLGPLAFVTALLRGWRSSADIEATLLSAWLSLLLFSAVGLIAGRLAECITWEDVRTKESSELAGRQADATAAGTQDKTSSEVKGRAV